MTKLRVTKPVLFLMLGIPGSGKTFFARQFAEQNKVIHLHADGLRAQVYETPTFSVDEDLRLKKVLSELAKIMLEANLSVVLDVPTLNMRERRELAQMAKKVGGNSLIIWTQIDAETAYDRAAVRDRRNPDDRFAREYEYDDFAAIVKRFKAPVSEPTIVISGKHMFKNQFRGVLARLHSLGMMRSGDEPHISVPEPKRPVKAPRRLHMDVPRVSS